jgi:hypothetical protein
MLIRLIHYAAPRTQVYLVSSNVEARKVGLALVPSSPVIPGHLRDAYTEARDVIIGQAGRAGWLRSQVRIDLMQGMSSRELRRRGLVGPAAEPRATEPPLATSAPTTSSAAAASEAPDSVWLCFRGTIGAPLKGFVGMLLCCAFAVYPLPQWCCILHEHLELKCS